MKNRPALGERALQELINDGLLKYNYFLVDVRDRNTKSYMKMPIPSPDDPARDQFVRNLIKHNVNIDEYCVMFEKSSIPSNNRLSTLSLQLFEHNACFVTQYSKYKDQLSAIIQKHLENGNVRESDDGKFLITNRSAFIGRTDEITNLVLGGRQEQSNTRLQAFALVQSVTIEPTTNSVINSQHAAPVDEEVVRNPCPVAPSIPSHVFRQASVVRKDFDVTRSNSFVIHHFFLFIACS